MRPVALLVAVSACAFSLSAGAAHAATWRGKTDQGLRARVTTGPDHKVRIATIAFRARCYRSNTAFVRPLRINTRRHFADGGRFVGYRDDGVAAHQRVRVHGSLGTGGIWRGTFELRITLVSAGQVVDRCRVRRESWSAKPVR